MKYLIVGLGNPGKEYDNTRHNIGFKALDTLVEVSNAFFMPNRLGDIARIKYKGRIIILLKPSTFMNLSGKAVNYWLQEEKLTLENLLVITDDLAIPFGALRLRGKGSDGGHNGLKDIISTLNSTEFARIRFGIGGNFTKGQQVNYVLDKWTKDEESILGERIKLTIEMVQAFTTIGLARTMSTYNNT